MKKLIIVFFILVLTFTLVSCTKVPADKPLIDDTENYTPVDIDEALTQDSKDTSTDNTATNTNPADNSPPNIAENNNSENGGTGICTVHSDAYHGCPYELIEYAGAEEFYEWVEGIEKESEGYDDRGCMSELDIYEFIHKFEIPKDVFIKWYNESNYFYYRDYDIDLLFDGSAEENEEYYRNHKEREENIMNPRTMFDSLKDYIRTTRQKELKEILGEKYGSDMSIAEMIYLLDISKDELISIIAEGKSKVPYAKSYDYDLDLIYGQREEVEALIKEHSAFYMDQLFCGEEPREQAYPEQ